MNWVREAHVLYELQAVKFKGKLFLCHCLRGRRQQVIQPVSA